jgi:hypothetical protein
MKVLTLIFFLFSGTLRVIAQQFDSNPEIILVDVDCSEAKEMLKEVLETDQANRTDVTKIDAGIDHENQVRVVSLIEKCGWPQKATVGEQGMSAVFLVIQHASKALREKYFPLINASAEKGELSLRSVAMMEDRMLMENGKNQKYGTQLISYNNGPLQLHPIEDEANVNKRRAVMGMEPIEDYLKHFGLEYKPKAP